MRLKCPFCKKFFLQKIVIQKCCSIKCSKKLWRKNNYAKHLHSARIYKSKNRELLCKKWKKYSLKNKEKLRVYFKRYNLVHKKEIREKNRERLRAWREIIKLKCYECGSKDNLEIHHLDYAYKTKNFVVLCLSCHHKKHRLVE